MSESHGSGEHAGGRHGSPDMRRLLVTVVLLALIVVGGLAAINDPILCRVTILGGCALVLWLSEAVPPYVTTLAFIAAILWFSASLMQAIVSAPS